MDRLTRRGFLERSGALLLAAAAPTLPGCGRGRLPRQRADDDPFAELDALGQAQLVRRGEVTPRELVEAAIARIERHDGPLNAVVTRAFERALARAGRARADEPFGGVPFLVKDLDDVAGLRTTYGSRLFAENVPARTDVLVARMEAAGLIVLGKTNTPEFGLLPTTQPLLFGPTRNPWDTTRDPGGSSGGAAAAVAAGLVPLAHASDGGGSIRIPASHCGVFGLKVGRGRNPGPSEGSVDISVAHCVSRTVRDSAALLQAVHRTRAEGSTLPPPVAPPGTVPGRLRIAFSTTDMHGRRAHPDCVAATQSTAALCASLGHDVEEAGPRIDGARFIEHFLAVWSADPAALVARVTQQTGRPPPEQALEPCTWGLAQHFTRLPPDSMERAVRYFDELAREIARFHQHHDVWLTPVLSSPPVLVGELAPDLPYETLMPKVIEYVSWTPPANAAGLPAMSVPLFWNAAGLPVGSHFVGRAGDEATLLLLAAQLEQARPWHTRRPPPATRA